MTNMNPKVDLAGSYTEASHTAYADVSGAEPIQVGSRSINPSRVVVKYNWRTQLGDTGWKIGNIEVSGPWTDPEQSGSGMVILGTHNAPTWVKEFAEAHMPSTVLTDPER